MRAAISGFLTLLLIAESIPALPVAFAQDAATPTPSDTTAQSTPPAEAPADTSAATPAPGDPPSEAAPPAAADLAASPAPASEPDGGTTDPPEQVTELQNQALTDRHAYGLRRVRPDVDEATGALIYRYPIALPPGRNGLEPDLGLTYNSQNAELVSMVGYGWSLDIPSISRLGKNGVDALYFEDVFTSSMSGELVSTTAATEYAPRIEGGDFLRYARSGSAWTVTDKRGTVYSFGSSAASRQDDPADVTHVAKWMLDRVEDANGNTILYTYAKAAGQIYPATIAYTGHGAEAGTFAVTFLRELQPPGSRMSYRTGFLVETLERISRIEVRAAGSLVRYYALAYEQSAANNATILKTITESALDASGAGFITLPPTTLNYSPAPTWNNALIVRLPNYPAPYGGDFVTPMGIDLFDVNQDSFPDVVSTHLFQHVAGQNMVMHKEIYLFDPASNRWNYDSSIIPPCCTYYYNQNGPWYNPTWGAYMDVNGDGNTDLIRGSTAPYQESQIGTGTGWVSAPSWRAGAPIGYDPMPPTNNYGRALIGDVNADGFPDIAFHAPGAPDGGVQINGGTGWRPLAGGAGFYTPAETGLAITLADVNGDGLADMVRGRAAHYDPNTGQNVPASYGTYLSTGRSFVQIDPGGTTMNQGAFDNGVRYVDMDGDGAAEPCQCFPSSNGGSGRVWIGDINGDGIPERLIAPGFSSFEINIYLSRGPRANVLTSVSLPEGGSYGFEYKGSGEYRDAQGNLTTKMPINVLTVRKILHADGRGANGETNYDYEGGAVWYDAAHPEDRRFAGFASIKKIEADGTYTKSYYHQGNGITGPGERDDSFAHIGKPYRVETHAADGALLKTVLTKWDETTVGGRDFISASETLQMDYDGPSAHRDRAVSSAYDPANGNLTTKTEWGEVQGADTGAFTDIGNDKFVTAHQYATDGAGRYAPSVIAKTDQSAQKVAETRNYYDGLPLGSLTQGNLTKEEKWKEGVSYVSTDRVYDAYGLVTQELDPRGKPTTYGYDALHLYPETVTDALAHATTYAYNYALGKVRETVDPNGARSQTAYDGFGRVAEEYIPDTAGAPGTMVLKTAYAYTDVPAAVAVHRYDHLGDGNVVDSHSYYDGLGRKYQERTRVELSGPYDYSVRDLSYNARGLLLNETLPYFGTGSGVSAPTGNAALWTWYAYDAPGRITATTNAVGTISHAFGGWRETITDARNKVKLLHRDAYDRLVRVDEVNGGATYITTYGWNGNGKLVAMTDALGNVRAFSYDGLGRRTMAQDLHAPADATFGVRTFGYDDSGNQVSATAPDGTVVSRTFDDINRLLTENAPLTKGTDLVNAYDNCPNGIGRLCTTAAVRNINTSYEYDALGNPVSELSSLWRPTGGVIAASYLTQRSYNRQGGVKEVTHPDGAKVRYIYNAGGLVERIERREPGEPVYSAIVTNFDYSPLGQVTLEEAANGAVTVNTYDSAELYRLRNRRTTIPGGTRAQDITYTYDPNGNILQIVDASQTNAAKTAAYTYDDLNRLAEYSVNSGGAGGGWYQSQWPYRIKVTIPAGQTSSTLSDFPIYVNLAHLPAAFHDHVRTDGGDIRVTASDGVIELAREIVRYDAATDTGELWVKVPALSSATSTAIYLYYGNAAASDYPATDAHGRNAVWSGYGFVSHDGGTTDSTGRSTPVDNGTAHSSSTVAVGGAAREFPGPSYVALGPGSALNPSSALSVCAWAYPTAFTQQNIIVRELQTYDPYTLYVLRLEDNNKPMFNINVGNVRRSLSAYTAVPLSAWTHVCGTYDNVTQRIYVNGAQDSAVAQTGSLITAPTPTTIGYDVTNHGNDWVGFIDEVRVAGVGLSADWLSAEYRNQQSPAAFYGVGVEESYGSGAGTIVYAYDAIGNIASSSDVGAYFYEGNMGESYANPHAVTSIISPTASSTFAYDRNGNMTASGNFIYAWDYRNRLWWSREGVNDGRLYTYNPQNQRVGEGTPASATYYPTREYEESPSSSQKKYVFLGDTLVATIENGAPYYVQTDHLSGSNVITNASGTIAELLDYEPYGTIRIDEQAGSFKSHRTFIGQYYDTNTSLSYLNARYYDAARGQFISQDPVFWESPNTQNLTNPQSLNSYAYANGNPITGKDPSGRQSYSGVLDLPAFNFTALAPAVATVGYGVFAVGSVATVLAMGLPWVLSQPLENETTILVAPPKGLRTGTIQLEEPGFYTPTPDGPPNLPPNTPNWKKWGLIGTLTVLGGAEIYDKYKEQKEFAQDFRAKTQTGNPNQAIFSQGSGINNGQSTNQSNAQVRSGNTALQSLLGKLSSALTKLGVVLSNR